MSDLWQHRSDNMKCKTCMWFVPKAPAQDNVRAAAGLMAAQIQKSQYNPHGLPPEIHNASAACVSFPASPVYDLGRCRKHCPTMGGFPVVFVNDWCGDHRIDENKVKAQ